MEKIYLYIHNTKKKKKKKSWMHRRKVNNSRKQPMLKGHQISRAMCRAVPLFLKSKSQVSMNLLDSCGSFIGCRDLLSPRTSSMTRCLISS
jgi:hypothetical protein